MVRYEIMAKRHNTNEPWTSWTIANNYEEAAEHAKYVEDSGYIAKIKANEEVEKMRRVFSENSYHIDNIIDKLFDVGFRDSSVVAKTTTRKVVTHILKRLRQANEKQGMCFDLIEELNKIADEYEVSKIDHKVLEGNQDD